MKKIIFILIFFSCSLKEIYALENKIIIKVENKIITNFELKNKILSSLILNKQEINQENINNYKEQIIDLLILNKLKELEIEKYKIIKNDKNINLRVQDYLNKLASNNISEMKKMFENNGVNFDLFTKEIKNEFLWQNLIYEIYSKNIIINDESVEKEVKEIIQKEKLVEEFRLNEIEVLFDKDKKKTIKTVQKTIEEIGFENAAKQLSISNTALNKGDLGWVSLRSLSDEIFEKVFPLETGQYSKPIIKNESILFLMVKDKKVSKAENLNIPELRSKIINSKKNELFKLYSQSHLSKLKNTSLIEYK